MAGNNTKHPGGRPTVMTPEIIGKLEAAFAYGATDRQACFYAGINPDTLYAYQKDHPEFTERKEALKDQPVMRARQTVVDSLKDPKNAQWYLERKAPDFKPKQAIEVENPQSVLLEAYGVTEDGQLLKEGETNDPKADDSISGASQDQT